MCHFADGRMQPLPCKRAFLPFMGELIAMRIGRDKQGLHELDRLLDEMRLSDIVCYRDRFTPRGSFSCSIGPMPPAAGSAVENGVLLRSLPINLPLQVHPQPLRGVLQ